MIEWIVTPARVAGALALAGGYAALCAGVAWRLRQQRLAQQREAEHLQQREDQAGPRVLVVYASQTGQAEALARDTARHLHTAGCTVQQLPVQQVTAQLLQGCAHSLWLLSTTGEGDAPDQALPFVQKLLPQSLDLPEHRAQVLALGDKEYEQFCAFGLRVHAWLQAQGAKAEVVCMDGSDAAAWADWQARIAALLAELTGAAASEWQAADTGQTWVLRQRTHLNPGSQGGPVHLLEWVPQSGELPAWESGDVVSLCVPTDAAHARDYSIASVAQDGCLQLLVRQSVRADGTPGVASSWLCQAEPGAELTLRIRAHSGFRLGENAQRPLVLIGNGTGLAGLCSHIKARVLRGRHEQWLLFGERDPAHDALLDAQLYTWLAQDQLVRLDHAWSRDVVQPRYVQHLLVEQADLLRHWVLARDAALYVCGSQHGMAGGVDAVLREVLGSDTVDALISEGRYRRDVY